MREKTFPNEYFSNFNSIWRMVIYLEHFWPKKPLRTYETWDRSMEVAFGVSFVNFLYSVYFLISAQFVYLLNMFYMHECLFEVTDLSLCSKITWLLSLPFHRNLKIVAGIKQIFIEPLLTHQICHFSECWTEGEQFFGINSRTNFWNKSKESFPLAYRIESRLHNSRTKI